MELLCSLAHYVLCTNQRFFCPLFEFTNIINNINATVRESKLSNISFPLGTFNKIDWDSDSFLLLYHVI